MLCAIFSLRDCIAVGGDALNENDETEKRHHPQTDEHQAADTRRFWPELSHVQCGKFHVSTNINFLKYTYSIYLFISYTLKMKIWNKNYGFAHKNGCF